MEFFFLILSLFSFEITDGVFVLVNHDVIFSIHFFIFFYFASCEIYREKSMSCSGFVTMLLLINGDL